MARTRLPGALLALAIVVGCTATPAAPSVGTTVPVAPSGAPTTPMPTARPAPTLNGSNGQFAVIDGANQLIRGERIVDPGVSHEEILALARANSEFALDLYRKLAQEGDDNILIGPHSISTALAMVYAGARGQTATDMATALHWDGIDDVPARFNALDFAMETRTDPGKVDLRLADQAFTQPGLPLVESYLETLSTQFGAPLAELAFGQPERARGVINDWVADQTNNRIQELFGEGTIDATTRLVLVNAMSLDAQWRYLFPAGATTSEAFTLADGSTVQVPTMHYDLYLPLAEEVDYSAVELMYGQGDLSMVLILPKKTAAFNKSVDMDQLDAVFDRISERGIHLALPKYSFERHVELDSVLKDLGMGSAYGLDADFSGMVEGGGLFLDTVQHEAFIEVDESGTEAHAATGGAMAGSHGPTIEFNRPFFFAIRDRITGAILFVGRVADPLG